MTCGLVQCSDGHLSSMQEEPLTHYLYLEEFMLKKEPNTWSMIYVQHVSHYVICKSGHFKNISSWNVLKTLKETLINPYDKIPCSH